MCKNSKGGVKQSADSPSIPSRGIGARFRAKTATAFVCSDKYPLVDLPQKNSRINDVASARAIRRTVLEDASSRKLKLHVDLT